MTNGTQEGHEGTCLLLMNRLQRSTGQEKGGRPARHPQQLALQTLCLRGPEAAETPLDGRGKESAPGVWQDPSAKSSPLGEPSSDCLRKPLGRAGPEDRHGRGVFSV